jgi:hypothetical protein
MATVTLTSVLDTWPAGTTVGAYPQANQPVGWDRASAPTGSTTATAVVAAGGSLAFTGLADDTAYVAAAQVSSVWKVRSFRSDAPAAAAVDSTARTAAAAAQTTANSGRLAPQNGLKAWTGNPDATSNATTTTAGRTNWVKVFCEESITFTTIWWFTFAAGSAGTPANFILGAAAQNGTLLGRTTDQSSKLTTAGENSATLTAEAGQSLAHPGGVGSYFWLGLVIGTHNTTPATFVRLAVSAAVANWGLGVSAGVKRSGYSTASGATTLATFTPSGMFQDPAFLLGVS